MGNDWRDAGLAWGARAPDWAYLVEPYIQSANDDLFDALGVGEGTSLLDVSCGAGFAASVASRRGASVAGVDGSIERLAIARDRCRAGDFREADAVELPFEDGRFDVVTSFNGIWKGRDDALAEAVRVVRPGGAVGITFWSAPKRLGLLPYFAAVATLSPPAQVDATVDQADTGRPGVAEAMFEAAGLAVEKRGTSEVINEWPDLEVAVRGLLSATPTRPALEAIGPEVVADAIRTALTPLEVPGLGLRIRSELGWLVGRKLVA